MIRNLKVLVVAAMALASLGAAAASAHAAEEKFHCSVAPCRVRARGDGTGKTAHQVFVVEGANHAVTSFTCNSVTAEATRAETTSTSLTFSNINYGTPAECSVNGSPGVEVSTAGCSYEFTSPGGGAAPGAEIHVECEAGHEITVTVPGVCTYHIAGGQRLTGARYHNIGEAGNTTREVTIELNNIKNVHVTQSGASCPTTEPLTSEYLTGNVIATGETDPTTGTPEMANAWWE